jgi:excisionase family DNA binding protein
MTDSGADTELMSVSEAARFLRVHPRDVLAAAEAGVIPSYTMAGRVLFSRPELLAAMSTRHPDRDAGA